MLVKETSGYKKLEKLSADSGNTFAFPAKEAYECFSAFFEITKEVNCDPLKSDELRSVLFQMFNVELVNAPDFNSNRYILAPTHVSDWDAIIYGLLHPRIRIVAKTDWTNNQHLKKFLDAHYDLYGLERHSVQSLKKLLSDAFHYFGDDEEIKHFLIFSQGTISDFNNNSLERISTIAQKISVKSGVPILPVFTEQVSFEFPTRIVFGEPLLLSSKDDFRSIWLEKQAELQNSLSPVGRRPKLTHKHSNNNKPGDPFF